MLILKKLILIYLTIIYIFFFCQSISSDVLNITKKTTIGYDNNDQNGEDGGSSLDIFDQRPKYQQEIKLEFFKIMEHLEKVTFIELFFTIEEKLKENDPSLYSLYFDERRIFQRHKRSFFHTYSKFFIENEERLECILNLLDPIFLFHEEKIFTKNYSQAQYLIKIWIFTISHSYLSENEPRRNFFIFLKELSKISVNQFDYKNLENFKNYKFIIAHIILRAIEIYRECSEFMPMNLMVEEKILSKFIYRGIRVTQTHDEKLLPYLQNFNSFAQNTNGVLKVLDFYKSYHWRIDKEPMVKTIIFIAPFEIFSQFFQTISFFGFETTATGSAFYTESSGWKFSNDLNFEKEIILPPFCDLKFEKLNMNKLNSKKEKERMAWHLKDFAANSHPSGKRCFRENKENATTEIFMITDIKNCGWKNNVIIDIKMKFDDFLYNTNPLGSDESETDYKFQEIDIFYFKKIVDTYGGYISPNFCEYFNDLREKKNCYEILKIPNAKLSGIKSCQCKPRREERVGKFCETFREFCDVASPVCFHSLCYQRK